MKYQDCKRLAKINLKERAKTTKSTVRGISFGLILIFPLLFIVMAFYVDLNHKVNDDVALRDFNIGVTDEKTNKYFVNNVYSQYVEDILKIDGVTKSIKYYNYLLENNVLYSTGDIKSSSSLKFTIDGTLFDIETSSNVSNYPNISFEFFDNEDPFLISDKDGLYSGKTFDKGKTNQIMVSKSFIEKYNLDKNEIIGKKISIATILCNQENITTSKDEIVELTDDFDLSEVDVLKDYTIVGVFNDSIYDERIRENSNFSTYKKIERYFWLPLAAIKNDEKVTLPQKVMMSVDGDFSDEYFYYSDTPVNLSTKAINQGMVFLPLNYGAMVEEGLDYHILLEFKNYKSASNAKTIIDEFLKQSTIYSDANIGSNYASESFVSYLKFYNIFLYVCLAFAIFGGVVFFVNLLNLYNTIHYSVESRKNYIGLSRAIGMKNKDIIKMYFMEIFEIFKRSYLNTIIYGGLICGIINILFNVLMKSNLANSISLKISLNPIFILVAFVIIVIVNTIISIIFSLVASSNVVNKPILEIITQDK